MLARVKKIFFPENKKLILISVFNDINDIKDNNLFITKLLSKYHIFLIIKEFDFSYNKYYNVLGQNGEKFWISETFIEII
jgi:hypothetical protein